MTTEVVYIKYKHYICKMEKEFVPYELALRMKQLGFDEPCFGFYYDDGELQIKEGNHYPLGYLNAPLFQQAFRWFRDNHSLFSSILPFQDIEDDIRLCYYYCIVNLYECKDEDILCNESSLGASDVNFSSPEDAELQCLIKLIEGVEKWS
jgi:hypothetical protein